MKFPNVGNWNEPARVKATARNIFRTMGDKGWPIIEVLRNPVPGHPKRLYKQFRSFARLVRREYDRLVYQNRQRR